MTMLSIHAMLLLPMAALAVAEPVKPAPALKDFYRNDFLVGVAVGPYVYQGGDKDIGGLVTRHFNALTCENAMKWSSVNATPDVYTFEVADRLVRFAGEHQMAVIGHTLVWHGQTPDWVFKGPDGKAVTRELLLARMQAHIQKVAGRYRGRIKGWDVVNEAVADGGPGMLRDSPWQKIIGGDFVANAYEYVRQADPQAELYYNDYNLENPDKRARTIQLVKSLLDKGLRIHAVGNQAHWDLMNPRLAEIENTIKAFVALGVKMNFTELDIDLYNRNDKINIYQESVPAEVLEQQAKRYASIFRLFHQYRQHIERVTFWGSTDKYSWLNDFPLKRTNHPLLFDRAGQPKPAFWSVVGAVGKTAP
jgi:endo-1,4-beta-xylanase